MWLMNLQQDDLKMRNLLHTFDRQAAIEMGLSNGIINLLPLMSFNKHSCLHVGHSAISWNNISPFAMI